MRYVWFWLAFVALVLLMLGVGINKYGVTFNTQLISAESESLAQIQAEFSDQYSNRVLLLASSSSQAKAREASV